MVETHRISDAHEKVKSTNIIIKVRTPVSWPPASWYKDRKSHDDQPDDPNKCKEDERREPQPNEGQRGIINFYVGDLSNKSMHG